MGISEKNPCKGCVAPKRHPGCYGSCQEHNEWLAEYHEAKELIEADRQRNMTTQTYIQESVRKLRRRSGKKGKKS